jgi:hypothetical protein
MKNIILLSLMGLFLWSCGTNTSPEEATDNTFAEVFTPANFEEKAGDFVGKEVKVKGIVDHVCSHGGKKMFLVDMEVGGRIRVNTGENMAAFKSEWEGSEVVATGIVDEFVIDEAYLDEWEEELKTEIQEEIESEEGCEYESYTATGTYKQIEQHRANMAEKGTTKLSFYSIIATSYEIIED